MRHVRLVDELIRNVRYALRTFRKAPAFTAVALPTLALGCAKARYCSEGASTGSDSGRSVDLAQRQAGGDASNPSYRRVVLLVFAGMLLGLGIACLVMSQSGFESRGSLEPRNTLYQGARPVTGDPGR